MAQIDSGNLGQRIDSGPQVPHTSLAIFAGAVDDEKIGADNMRSALCYNITLTGVNEIDLRLLDPEVVHIVRIF
jgi:hypothetical protein